MAQHYTLTSFLRQASNVLLAGYFEARGIAPGFDLKSLKHRQIEPLAEANDGLPEDTQTKINRDFQKVMALAEPPGQLQIVQGPQFQEIELAAGFEAQNSLLTRSSP